MIRPAEYPDSVRKILTGDPVYDIAGIFEEVKPHSPTPGIRKVNVYIFGLGLVGKYSDDVMLECTYVLGAT